MRVVESLEPVRDCIEMVGIQPATLQHGEGITARWQPSHYDDMFEIEVFLRLLRPPDAQAAVPTDDGCNPKIDRGREAPVESDFALAIGVAERAAAEIEKG